MIAFHLLFEPALHGLALRQVNSRIIFIQISEGDATPSFFQTPVHAISIL